MLERFLIVAVTDFKQRVRFARESGIESWDMRALPQIWLDGALRRRLEQEIGACADNLHAFREQIA
jgi:hypothetical protein